VFIGRSSFFVSCFLTFLHIGYTDLIEARSLPTLLASQQKRENQECFLFCDSFLSKVVGVNTWRDGCTLKVLEMSMASGEAFSYLLIGNYWDNWATVDLEAYKIETTFEVNSTKKKKKKGNLGKIYEKCIRCKTFWWLDG